MDLYNHWSLAIRARQDELARLVVRDNRKPLPETRWNIADAAGCFELYADLAERLDERPRPVDVIGMHIPVIGSRIRGLSTCPWVMTIIVPSPNSRSMPVVATLVTQLPSPTSMDSFHGNRYYL